MYEFTVMMSTYNGEKYLREQLDSILAQKKVNLTLYIRDDGSSDGTVDIIEEYMQNHKNIKLIKEKNVGYVKSFMYLVEYVGTTENMFYAFADQDDYWLEDKLFVAATKISEHKNDEPILYYSDLDVVNEKLEFIKKANNWEGSFNKFMALMFIAIRGCTVVYNSSLQQILNSAKPSYVSSHDGYIALLAYWTGSVIYDENAYIKYRQTGGNVSVTGVSKTDAFRKNVEYLKKRFGKKAHERENNARSILECYYSFIKEPELVEKVAYYKKSTSSKFALIKDKRYFPFHTSINIANVLLILAGKL